MAGPLLPRIFTPSDIIELQNSLRGGVDATDAAVQSCASADATTRAQWAIFRDSVRAYCSVPITGIGPALGKDILLPWGALIRSNLFGNSSEENFQTGRAYEQALISWQDRLEAAGCKLVRYVPAKDPEESGLEKALKWGAILAGVGVGAYVVSLVVPVVIEGIAAAKAKSLAASTAAKTLRGAKA